MTEEQQINAVRSRLGTLVTHLYVRSVAAAELLKHRSEIAPTSAEAKARELLMQANDEVERWIKNSGELVNVTVTRAELLDQNRRAIGEVFATDQHG